jgi:hypothetical protein
VQSFGWPFDELREGESMAQTPQEKEKDELVRQFLRELDACKTEQERIDKVMELVFGIVQSARKQMVK